MPSRRSVAQALDKAGPDDAALLEMDDTVGHIMSALATDNALEANTLTFLTGDNGPCLLIIPEICSS